MSSFAPRVGGPGDRGDDNRTPTDAASTSSSSPLASRHPPSIAYIISAMEASDSSVAFYHEPLALLLNALVQQPQNLLPLLNHFLVTVKPEGSSTLYSVLAASVTLFLVDCNEDLDFTRYRETLWYFSWLKDVVRLSIQLLLFLHNFCPFEPRLPSLSARLRPPSIFNEFGVFVL